MTCWAEMQTERRIPCASYTNARADNRCIVSTTKVLLVAMQIYHSGWKRSCGSIEHPITGHRTRGAFLRARTGPAVPRRRSGGGAETAFTARSRGHGARIAAPRPPRGIGVDGLLLCDQCRPAVRAMELDCTSFLTRTCSRRASRQPAVSFCTLRSRHLRLGCSAPGAERSGVATQNQCAGRA